MKTFIVTLIALFFLTACSESSETKSDRFMQKADALFEQGNFTKAVLEYKNVLQVEPTNIHAHIQLAESYLQLDDPKNAYINYLRVETLEPENLTAKLKLASFYFLMKRYDEADANLQRVLEKDPFNVEALLIQAGLLIQREDYDEAKFVLERAIRKEEKNPKPYFALAQILIKEKENDKAEKLLKKAEENNPESLLAKSTLFSFYQHAENQEQAQVYRTILEEHSDDEGIALQLAHYEMSLGESAKAEERLKDLLSKNPQNKAVFLRLANMYKTAERHDEFISLYQNAYDIADEGAPAKGQLGVSLAQSLRGLNRAEEADVLLAELVEKDPNNAKARLLIAEQLIKKRQGAEAIVQLDQLLEDIPSTFIEAHYSKALASISVNDLEVAKTSLEQLVSSRPDHLPSRKLLSRLYFNGRNYDKVMTLAERILEREPNNTEALKMLGAAAILANQDDKARQAFERMIAAAPQNADNYQALGLILMKMEKPTEAIENFEKVLALNPAKLNALQQIVLIHVSNKEPRLALNACDQLLAKVEDKPGLSASILVIKGQIYLAGKELAQAESLFEQAIKTEPNLQESYFYLARLNIERFGRVRAIEVMKDKIKENPQQIISYILIANMYDLESRFDLSESYYRKIIEQKPDYLPAYNNLAYVLAEQNKDLDQALKYARTAWEKLGESPQVLDTLGWIHTLKGEAKQALPVLQRAIELGDSNPTMNYHLGIAYMKNDQPELARVELEAALSSDQDFAEVSRAKEALFKLKKTN